MQDPSALSGRSEQLKSRLTLVFLPQFQKEKLGEQQGDLMRSPRLAPLEPL